MGTRYKAVEWTAKYDPCTRMSEFYPPELDEDKYLSTKINAASLASLIALYENRVSELESIVTCYEQKAYPQAGK